MIFEALTAIVGAGYGLSQAGERDRQAYRDSWRADLMYRSTKKRAQAEEAVLQNNLTIGAMDNTATNRDSAVAEYQNRSAQIAQAGVSGATSGTPFYRIDADAIQNRQRLSEIEDRGRMGLEGQALNLEATRLSNQVQIDVAQQNMVDSAESAAYASSPFAYIMGGLTGALSGASVGAGISTATKDILGGTVDELVGDGLSAIGAKIDEVKAFGEASNLAGLYNAPLDTAQRKAFRGERLSIMQPTQMIGDPSIASKRIATTVYGRDTRASLSLAALFPGAMGYKTPTLSGLSPQTFGQGFTFGGGSPLTQGAGR